MTDASQPNYPDMLGFITGGDRLNISVVQLALAVSPPVSRAGHPFEAILLIQNASAMNVDVTAALQIPDLDAKKQKKRFFAKSERLVVGLRPAEMGCVVLPLSSLPDTAPGDGYKLGIGVEVRPLGKPARVRLPEGGGAIVLEYVSDEAQSRIADLKRLTYSTTRKGLVGTLLEAPFSITAGQIGKLADMKPGWVSLWTMGDYYRDERLLLERYGDLISDKVLPQLKRLKLFAPLQQATQQRFQAAGYPLKPVEARFFTRMLVAVLEMAAPRDTTFDLMGDDALNVALTLRQQPAAGEPPVLPAWCRAMLRAIDRSERAADRPAHALATTLYDELLRDAIGHAFKIIRTATGVHLGSDEDARTYADRVIAEIRRPTRPLAFTDAYLPLVMGGIIFADRVLMPDERIGETLAEMASALRSRAPERDQDNDLVFRLAEQITDQALQKYGYRQ